MDEIWMTTVAPERYQMAMRPSTTNGRSTRPVIDSEVIKSRMLSNC